MDRMKNRKKRRMTHRYTELHTLTPTRSLTQVSSDTKSSMNSEPFDTLESSVEQYDPILMLSLNFDLPLPPIDN